MRRVVLAASLAGALLALPGVGGCATVDYSCSKAGIDTTAALQAEIQALPSTQKSSTVACDSGDPRTVYFSNRSTSQLIDELLRLKGCQEINLAASENNGGTMYTCRFKVGQARVWVEKDPTQGSNTAFITSAG